MLDTLRRMRDARGLTLIVIEHVMQALMKLCARIVVLHHGERIAEGTPEAIGNDERVLSVYFGSARHERAAAAHRVAGAAATARHASCTASTSRSAREASPPCSAPTAPARRR